MRYGNLSESGAWRRIADAGLFDFDHDDDVARIIFMNDIPYSYAMTLLHDSADWARDPALWPPPREEHRPSGPFVPFEGEVLAGWPSLYKRGKVELKVRERRGFLEVKPARVIDPSGSSIDVLVWGVPWYDGRPKDTFDQGMTLLLVEGMEPHAIVPGQIVVQAADPPPRGIYGGEELSAWWRQYRGMD